MSRAAIEGLLGAPMRTGRYQGKVWLQWRFSTMMHADPTFNVELENDKVVAFRFGKA